MTLSSLDELKEARPGRVALRGDEVALVLRGKQTKKVVERIRNNMKADAYGSGARKIDGVWQLPLSDLAEVIEPTPQGIPDLPVAPDPHARPHRRRKAAIGPRVTFVLQGRFWGAVLKAMGAPEGSVLLQEAEDILEGLRAERREAKAQELKATLFRELGDLSGKPSSDNGSI